MDTQRKEELVKRIMALEFKEGFNGRLTSMWFEKMIAPREDAQEMRENIERLRGRREGAMTLPMGEVAMLWFTRIFVWDEDIGPYESSRRRVGDLARQIEVTTAEAMELFLEVWVDIVRQAFKAPSES